MLIPFFVQEDPVMLETAHVHHILDGGLTTRHRMFRAAAYGNDTEVESGSEAAIQAQLFAAIKVAHFQSEKIEVAQIDRFLDLVGIVSGRST